MKCEVLIGQDAEDARLAGKRLELLLPVSGEFRPRENPNVPCDATSIYRLAAEQPVAPGDLTSTEAKELAASGVMVESVNIDGKWVVVSNPWFAFPATEAYRRKPEVKRVPGRQWEYKLANSPSNMAVQQIADRLNELGAEGWRLCGIDYGCFIMCREVEKGGES